MVMCAVVCLRALMVRQAARLITKPPIVLNISCYSDAIRALSAHSAAEFNISPSRWQHVWLVALVPP
jgi:hypothetical protein